MLSIKGSSQRSSIAPLQSTPGKPITSNASTIPCDNACRVSCVRPSRSPSDWRITSVPSSTSFVTTIWRKQEHYLCSTTGFGALRAVGTQITGAGGRGGATRPALVRTSRTPQSRTRVAAGAAWVPLLLLPAHGRRQRGRLRIAAAGRTHTARAGSYGPEYWPTLRYSCYTRPRQGLRP